jgi:hypothetical protein
VQPKASLEVAVHGEKKQARQCRWRLVCSQVTEEHGAGTPGCAVRHGMARTARRNKQDNAANVSFALKFHRGARCRNFGLCCPPWNGAHGEKKQARQCRWRLVCSQVSPRSTVQELRAVLSAMEWRARREESSKTMPLASRLLSSFTVCLGTGGRVTESACRAGIFEPLLITPLKLRCDG